MRYLFFIFLVLGQACTTTSIRPACAPVFRAVIDLGSGSSKLNMAEVDTCQTPARITAKIDREESRAVALEAAKTPDGEIPEGTRLLEIAALNDLRKVAETTARQKGYRALEISVVATHALRTARHREVFVKEIEDAGFSVRVLSQDEEGQAGYAAVLAAGLPENCTPENLLVWDVGGGSAELTRAGEVIKINSGSEGFRNEVRVLRQEQKTACPMDPESPNPLGKNFSSARKRAFRSAPDIDAKSACVVGIGGVHTKALALAIKKNWHDLAPCVCGKLANCPASADGYSKKEAQCLGELFKDKNDCAVEVAGPYARVSVSNIALVLGYMDKLGIERVHTRSVNMGDYFLLDTAKLKFTRLDL